MKACGNQPQRPAKFRSKTRRQIRGVKRKTRNEHARKHKHAAANIDGTCPPACRLRRLALHEPTSQSKRRKSDDRRDIGRHDVGGRSHVVRNPRQEQRMARHHSRRQNDERRQGLERACMPATDLRTKRPHCRSTERHTPYQGGRPQVGGRMPRIPRRHRRHRIRKRHHGNHRSTCDNRRDGERVREPAAIRQLERTEPIHPGREQECDDSRDFIG